MPLSQREEYDAPKSPYRIVTIVLMIVFILLAILSTLAPEKMRKGICELDCNEEGMGFGRLEDDHCFCLDDDGAEVQLY